jgi:hypothetical protein
MAKKKAKARAATSPGRRAAAEMRKFEAQDDLRTLQRASEISGDRRRMSAAQKEAAAQKRALEKIAGKK